MDGYVIAFFVPTVIFMVVVAPTWLVLHYRSKQRLSHALSEQERSELIDLRSQAELMLERIDTLEAILEEQTPGWRKRVNDE
ncbi:MAG: envelope stress response membrane protein PspB [Pseudomonadales bacterium]|nr:envelope stress response membrane protein PspB [Pseudomonadales bacterium]